MVPSAWSRAVEALRPPPQEPLSKWLEANLRLPVGGALRLWPTQRGITELGMLVSMAEPRLQSTLTCPHCGRKATEQMPTDACVFFYDCQNCGETLKPLPGDCCVFCSYGSVPCPPVQAGRGGGADPCGR